MIIYEPRGWGKDSEAIKELCGTWWKESLFYKTMPCEYKPCEQTIHGLYNMGAIIYVIGYDGDKAVTCYVAYVQNYIFNPSVKIAQELVWCIHKDYRNFKNLMVFFKAIRYHVSRVGVDFFSLASSCETQYDGLCKFLERNGMVLMEKIYMGRAENG